MGHRVRSGTAGFVAINIMDWCPLLRGHFVLSLLRKKCPFVQKNFISKISLMDKEEKELNSKQQEEES